MKKVLAASIIALVVAVMTGPASAMARGSSVHWNVKCQKLASPTVRPGVDCAHTMKPGETWILPKGVLVQTDYRTTGARLAVKFQTTLPGGLDRSISSIGPGCGSVQSANGGLYSIFATKSMVVIVSTDKGAPKMPARIKLIS